LGGITSLAEIASIGALLPFLGAMTAPEKIFQIPSLQAIFLSLNVTNSAELLLPLTAIFCLTVLLASAMRLLLLWSSTRLGFAIGTDLSTSIYKRTLYQPYSVHIARNSSELISAISGKANGVIYNTIMPLLTLFSTLILLLAILVALLAVDFVAALIAFGGFTLVYAIVIKLTRKKLLLDSQRMSRESVQVIKSLQEGLGGIRDVLIDGTQSIYCDTYQNTDRPLRRAQSHSAFISASPRYVVEAVGILLIAGLAYGLSQQQSGIHSAIPILGALGMGAQRLMPVLQLAYGSIISIQSGWASLLDTLDLLDQQLPPYVNLPTPKALVFTDNIHLKDLGFRYNAQSPLVLSGIEFTIPKGSRIGFIGSTGSGKTTLLDIIMGLLSPSEGTLEIDGCVVNDGNCRSWQVHIAHVPQSIFLSDNTIEENIAFGVPKEKIDHSRVLAAAQGAQIADTIETMPLGYETIVGERGVRLSGGQRQRIGIARALYKQASVLIFDEATSALDNETEKAVMNAIESLSEDLTLLMVAHRITTLKSCTQIIEIEAGRIVNIRSYDQIISSLNKSTNYN
jgi:ATP-binding cassette subfamily B protein